MTEDKEQFADRTKAKFLASFDAKFRKGDAEHHEDFFALDHKREAYDELIDLITYLSAAIEKSASEYERGYKDGLYAALHPTGNAPDED